MGLRGRCGGNELHLLVASLPVKTCKLLCLKGHGKGDTSRGTSTGCIARAVRSPGRSRGSAGGAGAAIGTAGAGSPARAGGSKGHAALQSAARSKASGTPADPSWPGTRWDRCAAAPCPDANRRAAPWGHGHTAVTIRTDLTAFMNS